MAQTRRGADRIAKLAMQAAAITAERTMRKHEQGCYKCMWAGTNVRMRCGQWWELAKTAHRARRALRQWKEPETRNINPLFTDEQCDPPPF